VAIFLARVSSAISGGIESNELEFWMVGWDGSEYAWRLTDGWQLPADASVPAGVYNNLQLNHVSPQPILSPTLGFGGMEHFYPLKADIAIDVMELLQEPGITFAKAEELNVVIEPKPELLPTPPPLRRRSRALSNASRLGYVIGTDAGQEVNISTEWTWHAFNLPITLLVGRIDCAFGSNYGGKLEVRIFDPKGECVISANANTPFNDIVLSPQDYLITWRSARTSGVAVGSKRAKRVGYLEGQPPILDDLVRVAESRSDARDEFIVNVSGAVTRNRAKLTVGLPRFELKW
jgi:hypothetical protein